MLKGNIVYCLFFCPLILWMASRPLVVADLRMMSQARFLLALILPSLIAWGGYWKKSLDLTAVPAVVLLGFLIVAANGVFAASIVAFFVLGSVATRVGERVKQRFDPEFKVGGQRNWVQVISNGGIVGLLSIVYVITIGHGETAFAVVPFVAPRGQLPTPSSLLGSWIHLAVLGATACCAGDTLASELGPVFSSQPPVLLVQPWRRVPVGTNGGVTLVGCFFSAVGGACIGVTHFLFILVLCRDPRGTMHLVATQWALILIGIVSGVLGSLFDSLLGSVFQFSGVEQTTGNIVEVPAPTVRPVSGLALLDNNLVNFFSCATTSFVTPFIAQLLV